MLATLPRHGRAGHSTTSRPARPPVGPWGCRAHYCVTSRPRRLIYHVTAGAAACWSTTQLRRCRRGRPKGGHAGHSTMSRPAHLPMGYVGPVGRRHSTTSRPCRPLHHVTAGLVARGAAVPVTIQRHGWRGRPCGGRYTTSRPARPRRPHYHATAGAVTRGAAAPTCPRHVTAASSTLPRHGRSGRPWVPWQAEPTTQPRHGWRGRQTGGNVGHSTMSVTASPSMGQPRRPFYHVTAGAAARGASGAAAPVTVSRRGRAGRSSTSRPGRPPAGRSRRPLHHVTAGAAVSRAATPVTVKYKVLV